MAVIELNVFVIPPSLWSKQLHSTSNSNVYEFLYAGKLRINREEYLFNTRSEIAKQLSTSQHGILLPMRFVFCRSVGRCFTVVQGVQEHMFKIKIFQTPMAINSEIFLLDAKTALDSYFTADHLGLSIDTGTAAGRHSGCGKVTISIDGMNDLNGKEQELKDIIAKRKDMERLREQMLRRMIFYLNKLKKLRAKSQEDWKKRYYEQKKLTPPIESKMNKLRAELEATHSKIVNIMRARMRDTKWIKDLGLPELDKESYDHLQLVTNATKLKHDVEEIQRIVDEGKEKLTLEIKLHCQAEQEARFIQADATRRNLQLTLIRSKELAKMTNRDNIVNFRTAF